MLEQQLAILREAIRLNPKLQLAFGVAGIGAVISIVMFLVGGDRELAVIGGAFVVGFMFLLAIFVGVTADPSSRTRVFLGEFLAWSISTIFPMSPLKTFFL